MPVYVYRCEQCGAELEKRQSFSDAPLTECENCHGKLRKVLSPAAVIYKGSGFYSTDHHGKSGGNARNGSSEKNGAGDKGESKSESKPAEAKESVSSSSSTED